MGEALFEEAWGAKVDYTEGKRGADLQAGFLKSVEDWEKLWVLDPHKDGKLPVAVKTTEIISRRFGNERWLSEGCHSPIAFLIRLRPGSEGFTDLVLHPDLVKKGLKTITESIIEYMKVLADAGINDFRISSTRWDRAFYTAEQMEEFEVPYINEILKNATRLGLYVTMAMLELPNPHLDLMMKLQSLGCFVHLVEIPPMGLGALKEKYGKKLGFYIPLFPTFGVRHFNGEEERYSAVLIKGKPNEVYEAVKERMRIGAPGGGFMVSLQTQPRFASPAPIPVENVEAAVKAYEEYGKYPIK